MCMRTVLCEPAASRPGDLTAFGHRPGGLSNASNVGHQAQASGGWFLTGLQVPQ